ncbi:PMS1 protein homolog 1 [Denticeps clupeoides]|uniref:PMS1 protein homolog 1 n=1 Tax=Denticeps clupeoides TaxID=299321 RepID=UPI0010A3B6D7|nr:PMS1 protein homolog 1 [Denticeps clupeoides]
MKHLPAETVRLLSSSQVINSVVNVVKELLENSLDAGSTSIDVKLENYGLDRIEVRDNGSGIEASDVAVMAVKHYTSKISCHEDLERLETYGFRGEALGSICAVSEVCVTTKTGADDVSIQYTLDVTGHIVSQRPSHLGQGTTVCALKLFKNLPVRRQYYSNTKKCKEEMKKVQDLLMAYAVVKPGLRVTLTHNKAVVWQKARVSDHRAALMAVIGAACMANLLPLQHRQEQPEITIQGYFPKPGCDYTSSSSSSPDKTFVFVNDRPVHHKDILKLVRQFCSEDPSCRRYPTMMMNIIIPPSTVDVNVTPDKTQVMLHYKEAVLSAVEAMLVSLYGAAAKEASPSATGQVHKEPAAEGCSEGIIPDHQNVPQISLKPSDAEPLETSENTSASACDAAGDASLNQTVSSSSSSEDWIINKSLMDYEHVDFSLLEDDVVSQENAKCLEDQEPNELSAESWSAGQALKNPVTGDCLEPVKLHVPTTAGDAGGVEKSKRSPLKKPANVIVEKMAKLTAYDLISNRSVRQPLSACALFEQETRAAILQEDPRVSLQDVTTAAKERWESLGEEDRKKYEEKARKALNSYNLQKKQASDTDPSTTAGKKQPKVDSPQSRPQGLKRKSSQQMLDKLFAPQPLKKSAPAKLSRSLPFSMAALRQSLKRLSCPSHASPTGIRLINRLSSHAAWVALRGGELMLLNPFRVEEALLFKRLMEKNILPTVRLETPIQLTDGLLGGSEYTEVLCGMEKRLPELSGDTYFSDPRLVANGFQVKLSPGTLSTERHMELTGMADCMPFFSVADLREILAAIKDRNAQTVEKCRPLKVTHYLEGEAVRLARQLLLNPSRDDVEDTVTRMEQQLNESSQTCIHGRPFFHPLVKVPEKD